VIERPSSTLAARGEAVPGSLGRLHGVAIYTAAILGAGVLALPSLAAQRAGPASIVAWLGLLMLCVPVASTFAALAARYPDAGGVSTFGRTAYGNRAATIVGYWFYFALPFGAPATALTGARYLLGGATPRAINETAAVLLLAAVGSTAAGLRLAGKVQLGMAAALAAVLASASVGNLPRFDTDNFEPFAPHGITGIASAACLLFFSFAGWEAVTHIAHEFPNPSRDVPVVTASALVVVSVLYLGLALVSTGSLGPALANSPAPVTDLLETVVGSSASLVAAVLAACLTYGAMSAYLTGASRLGAALARDGALWSRLSYGHEAGQTPRASTAVLSVMCFAVLSISAASDLPLADLMGIASTLFLAVTCAGVWAGVRLLPRGTAGWWTSITSLLLLAPLMLANGRLLIVPAVLAAAAFLIAPKASLHPSHDGSIRRSQS